MSLLNKIVFIAMLATFSQLSFSQAKECKSSYLAGPLGDGKVRQILERNSPPSIILIPSIYMPTHQGIVNATNRVLYSILKRAHQIDPDVKVSDIQNILQRGLEEKFCNGKRNASLGKIKRYVQKEVILGNY